MNNPDPIIPGFSEALIDFYFDLAVICPRTEAAVREGMGDVLIHGSNLMAALWETKHWDNYNPFGQISKLAAELASGTEESWDEFTAQVFRGFRFYVMAQVKGE